MYGAIVWANKASNYKKHLDRVQRLGSLAMAHMCCSSPTAGLEAILDAMLLDLIAQCVAVQTVLRVWGRNQSSWDGISCSHLRGHLLWGDKILKGVELKGDRTDKGEIKDLFFDRWKMRWTRLSTCNKQTIPVPVLTTRTTHLGAEMRFGISKSSAQL